MWPEPRNRRYCGACRKSNIFEFNKIWRRLGYVPARNWKHGETEMKQNESLSVGALLNILGIGALGALGLMAVVLFLLHIFG